MEVTHTSIVSTISPFKTMTISQKCRNFKQIYKNLVTKLTLLALLYALCKNMVTSGDTCWVLHCEFTRRSSVKVQSDGTKGAKLSNIIELKNVTKWEETKT